MVIKEHRNGRARLGIGKYGDEMWQKQGNDYPSVDNCSCIIYTSAIHGGRIQFLKQPL